MKPHDMGAVQLPPDAGSLSERVSINYRMVAAAAGKTVSSLNIKRRVGLGQNYVLNSFIYEKERDRTDREGK